MHRLLSGFIDHQFDAAQTENVGNFVRIDKHSGRAMRHDGAHELGNGQHAGFNVHVPVQESGDQVTTTSIDYFGSFADGMGGIRTHVCNPVAGYGDIGVGNDLARLDADPTTVTYNLVGGEAPHGNIY
jgi:hypothetical protein